MGAVAELWAQERDFGSGEFRIERWINGDILPFQEWMYFKATAGRILTKCDI